ncbi:hypothetical protein GCM10023342_20910 [Modicisalibacter zincidurans]|uniref:Uncharacterized protein n=1 Tax=Modicisalibacter zincidurans TaxID=1178777 RepID=A0ABP9REC6_9GAMM
MSPFAPWSVYKNRVSKGTTLILTLGAMNGSRTPMPCDDSVLSCTHACRSIDMSASGLMTLFCLVLGFQQVAIKAVAADLSPWPRSACARWWRCSPAGAASGSILGGIVLVSR